MQSVTLAILGFFFVGFTKLKFKWISYLRSGNRIFDAKPFKSAYKYIEK